MTKKKLLLLGNKGDIGSNFEKYIKNKYNNLYKIKGVDLSDNKLFDLSDKDFFNNLPEIGLFNKSLNMFISADIIINFAAFKFVDESFYKINEYMNNNYNLTNNILEYLTNNNYEGKYIHISTDEVYGESIDENDIKYETSPFKPSNPYSISKCACEYLCEYYKKISNINIIIVRPNNIYGIKKTNYINSVINNFIQSALSKNNTPLYVDGIGNQTRNFLHIDDFCNALYIIMNININNEIFNIGSVNNYSIKELATLIIKLTNTTKYIMCKINRKVQDNNYYINCDKIYSYGWIEEKNFIEELYILINYFNNLR